METKVVELIILSVDFFKSVAKVASMMVPIPYHQEPIMSYYKKNLFSKKKIGYLWTGFVKDWDLSKKKSSVSLGDPRLDLFFQLMNNPPIRTLFVSNEIKEVFGEGLGKKAFLIKASVEKTVKVKTDKRYNKTKALINVSYVRDVSEVEVMSQKSVRAFMQNSMIFQ